MTNRYVARGEGEPVLFVQGAGVPAKGWTPQLDGLSDRFHCAAFDNRGIDGVKIPAFTIDDMRRDALDVMDALGWKSAHVVGHSIGGVVAQALALEDPARVRSLTLMCTFAKGKQATRFDGRLAWVGTRTMVGTRRMRRRAFLEMSLSPEQRSSAGDLDAYAASYSEFFGRDIADPAPITMKQLSAAAKFDASSRLGTLDVPTLVMSATHDIIALPEFGQSLAALIPRAAYAELDAGHGLPITRAKEVNDALAKHFAGAHSASAR